MQQARLGISVGMLGAAIYLTGLFGGYLVAVILAGYVIIFEDNPWLRRTAVKAVTLMICFSLLLTSVNLVPDTIGFIGNVTAIFNIDFTAYALNHFISAVAGVIDIIQKILFMCLGIKALGQSTIIIPAVDTLISQYME